MSADDTFGAPVVEKIDGRDIEFPRLYMDFYGTLEAAVRTNRTSVIQAACDESAVTGKDRVAFVRDAAMQPVMVEDVDLYLCSEAGARRTIEKSLETANVAREERKEIIGKLTAPEATFLARRIVGFLRTAQPGDDAEQPFADAGPPVARDWDSEWALIVKHIPSVAQSKLTWHQYHLCLARARATERATNPQE